MAEIEKEIGRLATKARDGKITIDDMSGGYRENVNPKVELWEMNLVNGDIEECFERHQFDYVYHFAAYAAEGLSPFIRTYNYQNNLVVT